VTRLLAEIRELGYPGSANLLVRYLKQGRADPSRTPPPPPRRLVARIMTRPADVPELDRRHLDELPASCPHQRTLTELVAAFAGLLTNRRGDDLENWMTMVDAVGLPALHGFVRGLRDDQAAVIAGLTLPYSNGPIEGANNKIKLLKRQMYGRAGLPTTTPADPARLTSAHHLLCARTDRLTVPGHLLVQGSGLPLVPWRPRLEEVTGDGTGKFRSGVQGGPDRPGDGQADRAGGPGARDQRGRAGLTGWPRIGGPVRARVR
jgi:hypothetical protein